MLNILVSHNDDIKRLREKGYSMTIENSCLVVHDIPYLDEEKKLKIGAMVSKLIFKDQTHVTLDNHELFFCGSHPHLINGTPIPNLGGGPATFPLVTEGLIIERSFSNKPGNGYIDLFDKIDTYVDIIAGPAINLHGANPLTFQEREIVEESVFKYHDTLTSRAEIGDLTTKFDEEVIAIIGLGGTGGYILDFLIKTQVKEIRGFDLDWFHIHNAYRSPGKLDEAEFGEKKANVYKGRYDNFRHGVNIHAKYIDINSEEDLTGVTFAFVCVDKGSSRKEIFELLIKMQIPFIDVGIGLEKSKDGISGMARVTYYSVENAREIVDKKISPLEDDLEGIYGANIQISEINALNAALAVIKYKQIRGFYISETDQYHILLNLDDMHCISQ